MAHNTPMILGSRDIPKGFCATLAGAAALMLLSACDGAPVVKKKDPEITHCLTALDKLARDFEGVALINVRDWDIENMRNIALTFDYVIPAASNIEEDEALRGLMMCRYEYSLTRRTNERREAIAAAIRFRGRNLTSGELILLNTAIAGKKPRLNFPKY